MTKPNESNARKKPGPKPKVKPEAEAVAPVVDVDIASIVEADPVVAEAVAEAVEAVEPPRPAFPLIDGNDPKWAASASVGARHIQFAARDDVKHADLLGMLEARAVTIPGHVAPTLIASRAITPPKLHPVRVTFTVRERIEQ